MQLTKTVKGVNVIDDRLEVVQRDKNRSRASEMLDEVRDRGRSVVGRARRDGDARG